MAELDGALVEGDFNGPSAARFTGRAGILVTLDVPADTTAPTIANVTPSPGELPSRTTPIELDVLDVDPGLALVVLLLRYERRQDTVVVHDGEAFRYPFDSGSSLRAAIGGGYHYILLPRGGWVDDIAELVVIAADGAGNVEPA